MNALGLISAKSNKQFVVVKSNVTRWRIYDIISMMFKTICYNLLQDNRKEINQIIFDSDASANNTLTAADPLDLDKNADPLDLDSDMTANQRNQERTVARQQLAGHNAESSNDKEEDEDREEVVEEEEKEVEDEVVRDCSDVQMRRESQESEDRGKEDEQSWRMKRDEGRMEEEEEDEDAVKDRLCRLVAHARYAYFSSTDDDLDKTELSEGEWEEDEDEDEEWRNDKTVALSLKICQLEKEVRASQFSSTEDELDRVGVQEEDDGEQEELAVKVCKLAHQANATLFSSTEEELDGTGGGEETGEVEEESLWTFQAEKAARAAHLSSLVRTSRFSSTEDEQDVENGGGEVKGPTGPNWERRESFGDLDVKMFDLRVEIENRGENETWGDSLDSQRTDKKEEEEKSDHIEPEDEIMETEPLTVKEMEESPETREGGGEESNEEDEEFARMINSMLTMTLEDMQGGEVNAEAPEKDKNNRELDEKLKEGSESMSEGLRAESAVMETVTETVGASPPSGNKNEETESKRGEVMRSRQEDAAVVTVKDDRDRTVGAVTENERTDESLEEDKEEIAAVVEDTSVLGPLTPQEVQLVRQSTGI